MYRFREFVATAWGRLRPRCLRQLTQQRLDCGVLIRSDGEADPIGLQRVDEFRLVGSAVSPVGPKVFTRRQSRLARAVEGEMP